MNSTDEEYEFDVSPPNLGGIYLISVGVSNLFLIWLQVKFQQRAHLQPIKSRLPNHVQVSVILFQLTNFLMAYSVEYFNNDNCYVLFFPTMMLLPLSITAVLLRAVQIYSVYEAAQAAAQARIPSIGKEDKFKALVENDGVLGEEEGRKKRGFFSRNRNLLSSLKFQITVWCLVAFALSASFWATDLEWIGSCNELFNSSIVYTIEISVVIFFVLLLVIVASLMRPLDDGFFIKQELKFVAFVALFSFLVYGAVVVTDAPLLIGFVLVLPVTSISMFVIALIQILLPLVRSYSWVSSVGSEEDVALSKLLRTEGGFNSFQLFLLREMSGENLLLYDKTSVFMDIHSSSNSSSDLNSEFVAEAKYIYRTYVKDESEFQVNLSSDHVLRWIQSGIEHSEELDKAKLLDIIEEAHRECYILMLDPYSRYLLSSLYQQFMNTSGGIETALSTDGDTRLSKVL